MAKISIIVPIFNVEKYLDRCVQSLFNQTLKDIEIILVDDESPDNCPLMCDDYASQDSRVKVIHKKNGGLGYARNSGLEVATGDYITFVDSDDYLESDAYEKIYKVAVANDLDICYFKHRRFTIDGKKIEINKDPNSYLFAGKNEIERFYFDIVGRDPMKPCSSTFEMSVCAAIFRREPLLKSCVKFISEREIASEDLIFDIDYIPYVNKIGVYPYVLYNYFINPSSITTTYNEGKYQRMIKLLYVVKQNMLKRYTWNQIKNHYYSQQLRIIRTVLRLEAVADYGIVEKRRRLFRLFEEPIFIELLSDKVIYKYSISNIVIILFMKHKIALPLILLYKFLK